MPSIAPARTNNPLPPPQKSKETTPKHNHHLQISGSRQKNTFTLGIHPCSFAKHICKCVSLIASNQINSYLVSPHFHFKPCQESLSTASKGHSQEAVLATQPAEPPVQPQTTMEFHNGGFFPTASLSRDKGQPAQRHYSSPQSALCARAAASLSAGTEEG